MLLDLEVERRKFKTEVNLLRRNTARLQAAGAFMLRAKRPVIDVLFVPRWPLQFPMAVQVPAGHPPPDPKDEVDSTADGLEARAQSIVQIREIPALAARSFGVRFDLSGYDQRAPSVSFRDPISWERATYGALPLGQIAEEGQNPQLVVLGGHPINGHPFLCIRGVREYHEHPEHTGDDWALYRGSINVFALIQRVARVMLKQIRLQLIITPQLALSWAFQAGK